MHMNGFRLLSISLKWKFVIVFLLFVTIPTTLFGILVVKQTTQILNKEAMESTNRILNTVEQNVTSILNNINDISTYSIFSKDVKDLLYYSAGEQQYSYNELVKIKEQVIGYYTFHLMSKTYIHSISLIYDNDSILDVGLPVSGDEGQWSKKAKQLQGGTLWSEPYEMEGSWKGKEKLISLVREIKDTGNLLNTIGEIRIRLSEKNLYRIISSWQSDNLGSIFIINDDGKVIVHQDEKLLGQPYPDPEFMDKVSLLEQDSTGFKYKLEENEYMVVSKKIKGVNWHLVTMIDKAIMTNEVGKVKSSYSWLIMALLFLGIIALSGFYFTIVRPITDLIRETKKVEHGDFSASVNVRFGDEVGILGKKFNKMVNTIENLIETKYKLELMHKESELKALQAQINPHFLYNTLDTIRWTARIEKAAKTSRLIEILSRFFRIGLSGGSVKITLKDELVYTRSYLELQQERIGPELKFSILTEESIEHLIVLKQILQPLVENSIVHGFEHMVGEKWIQIRCYTNDNELYIDVMDNGRGFNSDFSKSFGTNMIFDGQRYALNNIRERLFIIFGKEYGLELIDHQGQGAWLRIRLPLNQLSRSSIDRRVE